MNHYDPHEIEPKWQKHWKETGLYRTKETSNKKAYVLDMFPYPSGEGLHVGHPKGYIATDIYSRYKRMNGFDILHPMGWDAFGLPAENFALKHKVHPRVAVEKNVARFKEQLELLGFNYDWEREIHTTDPSFYRWTQWIFLKLWEKGLAYESFEPINWCPSCKTGLANEDLVGNRCERCDSIVEKKKIRQWVLRITDYADRLIKDLEKLSWPESIKESQRNWIGRTEGGEIQFSLKVPGQEQKKHAVSVFTTRMDTLFGVTFIAVSPELASSWIEAGWQPTEQVKEFVNGELSKLDADRMQEKEKKGVFTGVLAIHPVNQKEIPVYVANYVIGNVGTGALMGVPAHDERDYHFAKKYGIEIIPVIEPETGIESPNEVKRKSIVAYVENEKTGEVLTLDWGNLGGTLLIGGGIEDGEDAEKTARREIEEETGYTDLGFIGVTEAFHHHYIAHSKNEPRFIEAVGLHFVLKSDIRTDEKREAGEKFKIVWRTKKDVKRRITDELHKSIYMRFAEGAPWTGKGILTNSGEFSGMNSDEARKKITDQFGSEKTIYKLRDWVFSRQRYWGEPIPLIHCEHCGVVPVKEKDLPVLLPEVKHYEPSGTGESPLANILEWVEVKCPKCGKQGRRETNTMPQWAGSSWYYLRYIDPQNEKALVDKSKEKKWSPVDVYVGGAEHATRHLIYARFWHKFLFDIGVVSFDEPFTRLQNVGLILAEDGKKMSKRYGNVINPDDIVKTFGADSMRMYEMFMGPFDQNVSWSEDGVVGPRRFLERVWALQMKLDDVHTNSSSVHIALHKAIKKIGEDIEQFKFNTAISELMILLNALEKEERVSRALFSVYVRLLAPFAPHITEEIWSRIEEKGSVHEGEWPIYDDTKIIESKREISIQVNGKVRDTMEVSLEASEKDIIKEALLRDKIKARIGGKNIEKTLYVKGRVISFVVKE